MNTVRVGMIGCGGIATGKHMPSLQALCNVEMVAFMDAREERAREARERFGSADSRVYTDYRQLLEQPGIDAVHICTPNKSHSEITVAALTAGKHVMCEKPMAITAAEAAGMVEAARRTGKLLTVAYQNRFREDSQYLKRCCERGDLGHIYFAKAHAVRRRAVPTWGVFLSVEEQGGGPLIDIGTHALDLTLWMMDNYDPLYAVGSVYHALNATENAANAFGPWDPAAFTVEDSAFGFIRMKDGATILLESSWALNTLDTGEGMTTLCGTKAGATMKGGLTINGEESGKLYVKQAQLGAGNVDFYDGGGETPEVAEARSFISAITDGTPLVVKPEEALVVSQILEGIYRSAENGQPYYF